MNMARYFRIPFANSGDTEVIPDNVQSDGTISYDQGYGPSYSRNPADDPLALRVERQKFNDLQNEITDTLKLYYETGVPPFITASDNGGDAFPYAIRARVLYDSGGGPRIYESRVNSNTELPTNATNWVIVDTSGYDGRYLLESNNLSDLTSASDARTNLGLGTAATLTAGEAAGNVALIGDPTMAGNTAVIVETGSNANGNYRLWSNGTLEQFGRVTLTSSDHTITLPMQYDNTDYTALVSIDYGDDYFLYNVRFIRMDSFRIFTNGTLGTTSIGRWYTISV